MSRLAVLANLELPDVQCESLPVAFFPLAPRSPVTSWWPDYLTDQDIRNHYFITGTDQLIDPLKFHHGRLWKEDKIIVPARRYQDVIRRHHDLLPAGHWGIARTSALIRRKHLIPNLKRRVQEYIHTCDICQRYKTEHHLPRGYIELMEIPEQKWQSVSMDWISLPVVIANGRQYDEVLTVTDRSTKVVHLIPTNLTTDAVETTTVFL